MFPLLPKGGQIKLLKFFWLKIFSICHRCRWHRWQTLSCRYLREFSKKFQTILMEYSGAGGKLVHEKNQKQKISWHYPFKSTCHWNLFKNLFTYVDLNKKGRLICIKFLKIITRKRNVWRTLSRRLVPSPKQRGLWRWLEPRRSHCHPCWWTVAVNKLS